MKTQRGAFFNTQTMRYNFAGDIGDILLTFAN
jgi:hypothetical protein